MTTKEIQHCLNCGNESHDGPLYRTEKDYDSREYKIEVCRTCRKGELETE